MENTLIVWVQIQLKEIAQDAIKTALYGSYSIAENDLKPVEDGVEFLFDDETSGNIRIQYIQENSNLGIKVSGDHPWEVMAIYDMITGMFEDGIGV